MLAEQLLWFVCHSEVVDNSEEFLHILNRYLPKPVYMSHFIYKILQEHKEMYGVQHVHDINLLVHVLLKTVESYYNYHACSKKYWSTYKDLKFH